MTTAEIKALKKLAWAAAMRVAAEMADDTGNRELAKRILKRKPTQQELEFLKQSI